MSSDKTLCIYHGNCADGFAAAWVVRKALGEQNVEFHPGFYGTPLPNVDGRDVVVVDYSFPRTRMEELLKRARDVLWIDHHKSAILDNETLIDGKLIKYVNTERSGAYLSWQFFFNDDPPPFIRYIDDRDRWQWTLPGSREFSANVFSYPYDFTVWDKLIDGGVEPLIRDGVPIERKHHKDIAELIAVMERPMFIGDYFIPVVNVPYTLGSDAAHVLAEREGVPYAAYYWDMASGARYFGLRSSHGPWGKDVSLVAKRYGGGGHFHAAGFTAKPGWVGDY